MGVQSPALVSQLEAPPGRQSLKIPAAQTVLPNLFVVGDTVTPLPNLAAVTQTALSLADVLATKVT
jgi:hypothetical protein